MNSDLQYLTQIPVCSEFENIANATVAGKIDATRDLLSSKRRLKHFYILLIFLFSISITVSAQTNTWDGSSSANWNTATNWSLNQVPTAAHDVVIPNGITANITVNTAAVCKTLTMNGGTTANTLTINNPNSLSVTGAITIGAGTGNGDNKIIAVGTGSLSCASVSITATGSGTRTSEITIATGTVNVTGNISMNDANDYIRFTGAGLLNIGGNITGGNLVPSTGTVNCNGSTAQTITGATTSSFYNLIINKTTTANTVTSTGNAMSVANNLTITQGNLILQATNANYTISNDLIIPVGGTLTHSVNWDVAGRSLNIAGNVIIDGLFTYTVRSHVQMSGTNKTIRTGPLPSGFSILTLVNTAGTISANGLVTVNDNFWSAFNVNGGTFSTNGQTVNANASLLNAGGTVLVNGGNLNVTGGLQVGTGSLNGTMTISSGTVTTDGFTIGNGTRTGVVNQSGGTTNINGNLLVNGACTYTCTNAPGINISGNWTINNTGIFNPGSSTVTFNNNTASQDINGTASTKEFYNLTINKTGQTLNASGSTTVLHLDGSLLLNAGTFNAGTATNISVKEEWTNHGNFIAGSGNVTFNGNVIQHINGTVATHFNQVTIDNGNDIQLNSVDAYIDGSAGALHFVQGKLATGLKTLVLGNAATITGAANGKYVFGNLQMGVDLGDQVKYFAIGDAFYFAPLTLTFNQVDNAGSITAFTTGAEHPFIASSTIDESQDANRYWTVSNNAVAFTNYDATFQYHSSDVDAGANTANFILGQYNGSWNYPVVGIIGASDITSIGLTDFGEFCTGEGGASAPTIATDPADQTFCSNSLAGFTATANSRPVSVVQWEISTDGGGSFSPLSMIAPYSMTTSSAAGITSSTLSINQPAAGLNGYQYRAVFTNNRGNATSAAAILTVSAAATADAGTPQTICTGDNVTLAGSLGGAATLSTWSAASGSFSDPSSLTSTYTPVIGPGNITLTLTSDDPDGAGPCTEAVSTVLISINPVATVSAGTDKVICSNGTATMNGSFGGGAGSASWSTSGTGSFNNNTPTAVYTPSAADILAGFVILTYTSNDPAGPCSAVSASMTLTINPAPTVNAGGPQTICSGSTITLTGSIGGGATGATWSAPSGSFSDVNSPVSTYSPSIPSGTVTLTLTSDDPDGPSGPCSLAVSTALFTVNTSPTTLSVTPASANVCQDNIISLTASGGNTITTANSSFASGTINAAIPDNNAGGVTNVLAATGIPAGATINSIGVTFNIAHNNVGDLILNLKAPNGNILNLVNRKGNTGNNFTNSTASSNGVTLYSAGTPPFTGTFAADGVNGIGATGQVSNVVVFSGLYSIPNGNWTFSARDAANGTSGTISSWSLVINWTAPVQDPVTWTPVTDLFTNPAATNPYLAGQNFATIYVKPSTAGNITYTALATSGNGCTAPGTADLTVIPAPTISALPATQSICSQTPITQIDITNPNNLPGTTFSWTRTNTVNITGIASSGTGNAISGTLTNNTNTAQTTIFTITADDGTCTTTQTVSVTVNPKPTVNATPSNQTVCSASAIGTITITNPNAVAGTTFSWTRDNAVNLTGIAASGSGATIIGTLTNNSNVQQVTTFTITATAGTCTSVTSVTVTVNPRPTVSATPLTQTLCSAVGFGQIDITNPNAVAGTVFSWTRDNTVNLTGVAASGSGAAINGTLANATNVQQTTNFTITATAGTCTSTTTVNVKVNPVPSVNSVPNASFCNNGNGSAINFGSNVAGASFAWTSTANVGFGTSGNGNIPVYIAANAPVTATVSVTATANGCSGPVRTFTITINPLPTVTVSADYCIVPGKVRLTANPLPAGTYTYLWSTGATTQVIDVDIAGSYTVTVTNTNGCKATNSISIATELAVNGNFEAGNVGFTSGYTYDASANGLFAPEGKYAVNNNPNFNHNNFWGTDHTTASGKMMIVNGIVGPTVWQQTVTVQPNTTYYFSAWALSMNNVAPFAQLQFSVNGSPIGVSAVLIAGVNNNASNTNWQRFYGTWSSGALTTATCSILDLQGALGGNDFALDDISISTLSPAVFSAIPSVLGGGTVICQGSNLQLSANLQGGSSPYTFSWTGPGGFTSNVQNPVIPNATVANSGTYSLSVIDFYGCVINSSRDITVSAPPAAPSPVTATPATICLGSSTNLNGTTINGTQSDFTGTYAPANWTISNNPALTGGSVNTSGAPNLISITSGDNGTAGNTDFTITNGPLAGNYIFNWSYTTTDAASRDIPQYSVNGGAGVNLPGFNTAGSNTQNGTASIAVPANQTFTLRMRTTNGTGGNGTVTITMFNAPQAASISWYTVASGGTSIGTSVNASNFSVTPVVVGSNAYYAEAISAAGCISTSRTQVNVTVNQPSVAPTSLVATPNTICNGQSTTLTQTGGSLGTGASWKWYSNNTYTTLVGTGTGANASLTITPAITTTYYLRIEGTSSPCTANVNGPGSGVTVTVRQPSVAPTSLNASVNPICRGNSTTLTQTGGSLGTGATWKWYSDAAYTVFVANGTGASASLSVSPIITTTYYLRAEGTTSPCSANVAGPAAGITITVQQPSVAPTSLVASPATICNGSSSTLTQTGGSLGTGASWKWYSNNTYTTLVGTGTGANASLSVSPAVTTTYYLRIEGTAAPCTGNVNGPAAGVTVTVNQPSIAPFSLNASANPVCNGNSTTLTQTGGSLGTGASWKWYSNNTYTTLVGTGIGATASLTVSPTVTTTYYLRSEGGTAPCASNVTGPASGISIVVNQKSANPVSASASETTICSGSSVTLTLNGGGGGTGEVIAWYTGSCGGTLVGTGNNLLVSPAVTTTYFGRYENASPCNFNTTCVQVTINVTATGTWLGLTADWNDPANWCGGVPTVNTDVTIPSGKPNDPVIAAAIAEAKNLAILPGATVTIDGHTLKLAGSLTSNAALNAVNGSVELVGTTGAQTIAGSMFEAKTIMDLKISNAGGVNFSGVNDTLKISGLLHFGTSNAILNTNNNLTLLSTAGGTASVGDLTSGGLYSGNNIIGNTTVERFVPNHSKAWQFLAAPTSGQTVNAAWQEGNAPLANTTHPGYGTIITSNLGGNNAGSAALGFDIYTPAGPTMKTYNPLTDNWVGIPSTNIPIANSKGYMLFVRGDRSVNAFNQPATEVKLRTTGKLYTTGPDAPPVTNVLADKFESIGNPYASAIDFSKVNRTGGVQDVFYVWDPKLTTGPNSAYGLGGYQTFVGNGTDYIVIPGDGSYAGGNTRIESGLAFFVHAVGSGGTVTFAENCKVNGSNLVTRGPLTSAKQLRTNLSVISTGNNIVLLDGALSQFDASYSNNIDVMDALKIINNGGENISIRRAEKIFVAERRADILNTDTIFYQMGQLKRQNYQFSFIADNLDLTGLTAYLEDAYLQTSTPLNLSGTTLVQFTVDANQASAASNRFRVVFKQMAPVPVSITAIKAKRVKDHEVEVTWQVENETSILQYELEHASDGRRFNQVATRNPLANNGGRAGYTHSDMNALSTENFYRVKAISNSGLVQYSPVVKVSGIEKQSSISVYPNPVINKSIQLSFTNKLGGNYSARLVNNLGQVVQTWKMAMNSNSEVHALTIGHSIASGNYILKVQHETGEESVIRIMIQ